MLNAVISLSVLFAQVLSAKQQRALCHIGAIARGFLTRRLLKTEKVRHLRQTVAMRLHTNTLSWFIHKHTTKHCGEILS